MSNRTCFVVGPIGDVDSEARVHADWLLEGIIEPVIKEVGDFDVIRADKIAQPGMIDAQVIKFLMDSDLVIADLSMLNPNAFYEIGIRHMVQKPIIHMQLSDGEIPFDVSLYRALKFSRARPSDLRLAQLDLKNAIASVLADDYEIDNPITRVKGRITFEMHATSEQKVILQQIGSLQEKINKIEKGISSPELLRSERRVLSFGVIVERSTGFEGYRGILPKVRAILERESISCYTEGSLIIVLALRRSDFGDLWEEIARIPGVINIYDAA